MPIPDRFSKAKFRAYVEEGIAELEKKHGFKFDEGFGRYAGKGEEINRAFGHYECLRDLLDELE